MSTYQVKDNATGNIYEVQDNASSNSSKVTGNPTIDMKGANQDLAQAQQDNSGINPYLKALQNTQDQSVGAFSKGVYSALSPLKGLVPQALQQPLQNFINSPTPQTNTISDTASNVARALGSAGPTIAMANPYIQAAKAAGASPLIASALGFGGFSGTKAALDGKSSTQTLLDAAQGVGTGLAYGVGGILGEGATSQSANLITKAISKITKSAPQIISPIAVKTAGTAIGQAAAGAMLPGSPQDKITNAVVAGGLGALSPSKVVNQDEYNSQIDKNAETYRNILSPTPGDVRKIEIGSGRNIDDYYKLAAQEGLVIGKNSQGQIDTSAARKQLELKSQSINDSINQDLASNPSKQFNLNDIRSQAKTVIDINTKNATEIQQAQDKLNTYINDEITRNGLMVDGTTLNKIKQGMWSIGYNQLAPNDQVVARKIGTTIKNTIESAYPQSHIQEQNAQLGKYLTLDSLLENAHGKNIKTNSKFNYPIKVAGAAAGYAGGHIGGAVGGWVAGGKASDMIGSYLSNPTRVTGALKNRLDSLTVR